MTNPGRHVVIAGAGVGAIEAALALRAVAGELPGVELIAPERDFVYRAMAVAEPFGRGRTLTIPLERLERRYGLRHRRDAIAGIDPDQRRLRLRSGAEIGYDALIVAVGARPERWLDGAVTFTGPAAVPEVRRLLGDLESGAASSVLFAAAPGASWTLPVYELALLTGAWCAENDIVGPELTVATPELEPLVVFGPAAARAVRELLADRGIRLVTGTVVKSFDGREARLARDRRIPADAVVTLPRLAGNPIPGLPATSDGFVPVDEHCAVVSTPRVWAVGDVTTHSVKQGGLAAQQADVAARAVARAFGIRASSQPYRPALRGLLLTGVASAFLRQDSGGVSEAAYQTLWWPPSKVAGRYLAPFLADLQSVAGIPELEERGVRADLEAARRDRDELRELARELAEADVRWGDHRSALRWLQALEWLDGTLTPDLAALRDRVREAGETEGRAVR